MAIETLGRAHAGGLGILGICRVRAWARRKTALTDRAECPPLRGARIGPFRVRTHAHIEQPRMQVTNINGTSDNTCRCGSWLAHWRTFSRQELPALCAEIRCIETPEVGAHVQKAGSSEWFIIPFCKSHNALQEQALTVVDWVPLVSANVSQTCGR